MENAPKLSDKHRRDVAIKLTRVLADAYTLYFKTHGFHWNVKGPQFYSLHHLFEEQYNEMWLALDVIAERIRALGFGVPGSYAQLARLASVKDQTGLPPAEFMVHELADGHETVATTIRNALITAQEAKDDVTVEILTSRLEAHEKAAWMLSASLTPKPAIRKIS